MAVDEELSALLHSVNYAYYYTSRGGFAVGADLGRRPGEGPRRVCLRRTGGCGGA